MDTNRKHTVVASPQRARAATLGSPLGHLAHRFWSGQLAGGSVEATRAVGAALDDRFNPLSRPPALPTKALCGELEVDRSEHSATLSGSDLHLTGREYAVLLCLVDHANRLVPRSDLLATIWTLPDDYGSNVVDVYIRRLRQKFGAHAGMIRTIRGFGYCLRHGRGA